MITLTPLTTYLAPPNPGPAAPQGTTNTSPLPNPWAPPGSSSASSVPRTTGTSSSTTTSTTSQSQQGGAGQRGQSGSAQQQPPPGGQASQGMFGVSGTMSCIPYSRKYWWALNLTVEPQIAVRRILADLNLAVRYGIAIRIYASRKF